MENKNFNRPLKQPKLKLDINEMNPILRRLIETMNKEKFMVDEPDLLKRLEQYKKKMEGK
jgi:hypothetical protein